MATKRTPISESEQLAKALGTARKELEVKGSVGGAKLGPVGLRSRVAKALLSEGYEQSGTKLRAPLDRQLKELMAQGAHIPITLLPKRLAGTNLKEAQLVVANLVQQGAAHLVLRGQQISLVPPGELTVPPSGLAILERELKALLATVTKAKTQKLPVTLLASDVAVVVSGWKANLDQLSLSAKRALPAASSSADLVRGALLALSDEETGLVSVPALSRHLAGTLSSAEVKDALLSAFRRGELELRPEGGLGRLSDADRELCPAGAGGLPLSSARLRRESADE
jgi:hypothetical protein